MTRQLCRETRFTAWKKDLCEPSTEFYTHFDKENHFSTSEKMCTGTMSNTRNSNSIFNLPLELQNFSGTNLLDGSSFVVNGNTISLAPYEILVFK